MLSCITAIWLNVQLNIVLPYTLCSTLTCRLKLVAVTACLRLYSWRGAQSCLLTDSILCPLFGRSVQQYVGDMPQLSTALRTKQAS
jgi:hypothetical protein